MAVELPCHVTFSVDGASTEMIVTIFGFQFPEFVFIITNVYFILICL